MSKVFITTTAKKTSWAPYAINNFLRIVDSAKKDVIKKHTLVQSPNDADIILFVDSFYLYHWDIINNPIYKRFSSKCYLFDTRDNSIPRLPGIYMGIPRKYKDIPLYRTGFYLRVANNDTLDNTIPISETKYLFSFVGNIKNAPKIRKRILNLKHPRALLQNSNTNQKDNNLQYSQIIKLSKFVLCPRGYGPSTWRLFETMRAGRVPVVISDEWIPPIGIQWNNFIIRIAEKDINEIPNILENIESNANKMGIIAYHVWVKNFTFNTGFNWIVENCLEISKIRFNYKNYEYRNIIPDSLNKLHAYFFWKEYIGRLINNLKKIFFSD